jgi:exosome complex component CSL4
MFYVLQFEADGKKTVSVKGPKSDDAVPKVGQEVTCVVTKINLNQAYVKIVSVEKRRVRNEFSGIIRREDIRSTEIDKVEMVLSLKPDDVLRACVISLGDSRSYFLSTAKNEHGVIAAKSEGGHQLIAYSHDKMQCTGTGLLEPRKVAKL